MHRANLNNHPELPELRHRRMPQALTTTMQSGSMRYGGRDSRSNMKDGTRSPVAMPACTVPSRVKCLHHPGVTADPLTEVLRAGARELLAQAIEAEVAAVAGGA